MGRSYTMKDGRKVLVPTERQLARMAAADKEETLINKSGLEGMPWSEKDRKSFVEWLKGHSAKEIKEALDRGVATDLFLTQQTLNIMEDLRKGIIKDDINDKKFKFNLEKLINNWKESEIEFCAVYDKNNRFIGINIGKENTVQVNIYDGQLVGGTSMHNHPYKGKDKDRTVGGSFSLGDFKSFKDSGSKREIVTAREGTYEMSTNKRLKFKDKDLTLAFLKINARIAMLKERMLTEGFSNDAYNRAYWYELHTGVKNFCSANGINYKFTPNKGFENITDLKNINKPLPPAP